MPRRSFVPALPQAVLIAIALPLAIVLPVSVPLPMGVASPIALGADPPAGPLDGLHSPPSPLPADLPRLSPLLAEASGRAVSDAEGWARRRGEIEARWKAFLGELPAQRVPLDVEILETEVVRREAVERKDVERKEVGREAGKGELVESAVRPAFSRKRVRYAVEAGVTTDGYLLEPMAPGAEAGGPSAGDSARGAKLPAVVVFHATTPAQAKQPAGRDLSKPELAIGVHLVERGFVVLCPRCYIFDEGADYAGNVEKARARHPGWKGMTRMVLDAVRAADYLESLPNVDASRIACIGHSLGAKEALYAAAFDARYRAAVFSEGGIGLSFSNWDAVWYLGPEIGAPGFPLEHHELVALIAPRAFLLLAGDSADGAGSWAFIEAALPVYRLFGAEGSIGWVRHGDGHRYSPKARAAAEAFIERWTR